MKTIMIVEDETDIRNMVNYALSRAGFKLIEAADAQQASALLDKEVPELILMDRMLPGLNGVELTKRLKRNVGTRRIPVIMLTAMAEDSDKITGLNSGADDYISKPFSPGELVARINAVLRRGSGQAADNDEVLVCAGLALNMASHRVSIEDEELNLGPKEFRLLKFFMEHPERVFSREQVLNHVWGQTVYVEERTVDVHILRLRKSLQESGYDRCIQTVRGSGYRFSALTEQTA